MAAWLHLRGRDGMWPRELLIDETWTGKLEWRQRYAYRTSSHRPDLVYELEGMPVAVEVELARKSMARLRAILGLHHRWWATGRTAGVFYVCADQDGAERVRKTALEFKLGARRGHGIRIELLNTITEQAIEMAEARRRQRSALIGRAA
jgi:hypothetical protein